jgi:hypothetical protein
MMQDDVCDETAAARQQVAVNVAKGEAYVRGGTAAVQQQVAVTVAC